MKKKGVMIFIVTILAFLISLYFDSQIVKGVSLIRNSILTNFLLTITLGSFSLIVFFFLGSFLLSKKKQGKWVLPLWVSLGISMIVSFLLKISIQRPRPFQTAIVATFPILASNSHLTWNSSFPSFQAMMAFCALPILLKKVPKFKFVWIIFALLIAFSRVYFGVHFLSDVIAGGFLGYLIGVLIISLENKKKIFEKIQQKIKKKILKD